MASALITGLISLRLYSAYFDVDRYGLMLVALQILAYLPMLDGGFRTVLNRHVLASATEQDKAKLVHFGQVFYSYAVLLALAVSVVAMAAYAVTPNARNSGEPPGLFMAMGVAAALSFFNAAQAGLLVGLRAQGQAFLLNATGIWVNLGALWAGLKWGAGLWAFVFSMLAVFVVTWPIAISLIKRRLPGVTWFCFRIDGEIMSTFRRLRSEAWACCRGQVVTLLLYSVDLVIVGTLGTPAEAAVYGTLARMFAIMRSFLQSSGEASWPIIAEKGLDPAGFGTPLMRVNAWAYGAVLGAAAATLLAFCRWYMGPSWTATPTLLALFVGRYLVTGLAVPASYCLFGLGRMELITRCLQRELAIGLALGLGLWFFLGMNGIAAGFAVATVAGTFLPLFLAYAEATGNPAGGFIFGVWWRALVGFALSFLTAAGAARSFAANWQIMAAGALGVAAGLGAPLLLACLGRADDSGPRHWSRGLSRALRRM